MPTTPRDFLPSDLEGGTIRRARNTAINVIEFEIERDGKIETFDLIAPDRMQVRRVWVAQDVSTDGSDT